MASQEKIRYLLFHRIRDTTRLAGNNSLRPELEYPPKMAGKSGSGKAKSHRVFGQALVEEKFLLRRRCSYRTHVDTLYSEKRLSS